MARAVFALPDARRGVFILLPQGWFVMGVHRRGMPNQKIVQI